MQFMVYMQLSFFDTSFSEIKDKKGKQYKILTLCINLRFITSQQIVIAWLIPVTKPFTWSAHFSINPGLIPKLRCSSYVPAQKPGNYWKMYIMGKDLMKLHWGEDCFSCIILFYFSEGRKGKVRILSYLCVSFASSYFWFTKEIVMVKDTKRKRGRAVEARDWESKRRQGFWTKWIKAHYNKDLCKQSRCQI